MMAAWFALILVFPFGPAVPLGEYRNLARCEAAQLVVEAHYGFMANALCIPVDR